MRLGWLLSWVAIGCWAGVGSARAQDKTGPALNWTRQPGAESCIASVELAARVEARVKRPIFVAAPQAIVAVEGYVTPLPSGGFRAVIAMSDGQGALYGSRELTTAGACSELDDGLVFVIAVTLRPEGGASGIALPENVASALDALFGAEPTEPDPAAFPAEQQPAQSAAPPHVEPPPVIASEPPPAPAAPRDVNAFVEALVTLQLALQPGVALGGGGGIRVRVERIGSFSLHGAVLTTTSQDVVEDGEPGRVDFSSWLVWLGYCTPALVEGGALGLEACAAGRVGRMNADSNDSFAGDNLVTGDLFGAVALAARLAFEPNDNVVITLAAGPELHVARPVFVYQPAAADAPPVELFKVGPIGGAAELSVAFALF